MDTVTAATSRSRPKPIRTRSVPDVCADHGRHVPPALGGTDGLCEDGGQRGATRTGILPALRLADLCDRCRRGTKELHGQARNRAPARPTDPKDADLDALAAKLAERSCLHPTGRNSVSRVCLRLHPRSVNPTATLTRNSVGEAIDLAAQVATFAARSNTRSGRYGHLPTESAKSLDTDPSG